MRSPLRAVVGSGAWGTTLAVMLARSGPVTLVVRSPETATTIETTRENAAHLPGVRLPREVLVTADEGHLATARDLVVMAVPAASMRAASVRVSTMVRLDTIVVSVAKGIEHGSLSRMSQVIAAELPIPVERICCLSGPNLATEIAAGLPASAVVAAIDDAVGAAVVEVLGSRMFRLYRNRDLVGVELAGALKNIVAIAAGAADALHVGDNGTAAIITRGLAEITRLGVAAGADPRTFAGLAGMGDLIATCASPLSRNHRLGMELAGGRRWVDIEATLPGVAEGAYTVEAALALAETLRVDLPIVREVDAVLHGPKSVHDALHDLLACAWTDELSRDATFSMTDHGG